MSGRESHTLRPMRWWDLESVSAVEHELFAATAWSPAQFWGELAQPTRTYVVAEAEGVVIGYAGVYCLAPTSDVQTIAVDKSWQGRGLGREMLRELLGTARERGCAEMLLEVAADNSAAIALYESEAFEVISRRRDYYGPAADALIMRRRPL